MRPDINYLSKPEGVSMGDAWFSVASPKHFWIRRRFQVLQKLAGDFPWSTSRLGEIGCGSGLVQRQVEDHFGTTLDGFDLNEYALKESVCQTSQRYCYNIHARNEAFKAIYDGLILFDVIEHLDDHKGFLESALFHVKPGGRVFINVPADAGLMSAYDKAAGHVRRYGAEDLLALAKSCGLGVESWTYWGRPLRPLLKVRRWKLRYATDADAILRSGFTPPGAIGNALLMLLSQFESIPQHKNGSSLMLVARMPEG
jgi:SAM-dependent methyltransferase